MGVLLLVGGGVAWALSSGSKHAEHAGRAPATAHLVRRQPAAPAFVWPFYGYSLDHQRAFSSTLRPPYRRIWTFNSNGLLEFPPVISAGVLFQLNDNAVVNAVNAQTGQRVWYRKLGVLSASTPAVGNGAVYVTVLDGGDGNGRVVALSAGDGHTLWQRELPSASESSPLLHDGIVYFGSQGGTVYALRASDGSTAWTYDASGSVKGSPTYWHGMLFFGDYGDQVHAISARTGQPLWSASGSDSFYATAAVGFGRVYIGDTSGEMYAFDARSGNQLWEQQTGNDIYASAAVLNTSGLGPTIYLGSYDGTFYALDAGSGGIRWSYAAGGRISGSATIIGSIVYFADLGDRSTIGLDLRSGHPVFNAGFGEFDPGISDGQRLYLSGYASLVGYVPAGAASTAAPAGH